MRTWAFAALLLMACSTGASGPSTPEAPSPAKTEAKPPAPEVEPAKAAPEPEPVKVDAEGAESAPAEPESADPPKTDPLAAYVSETPRCRTEAGRCFSIALHLTMPGGSPVQTVDWVSGQIRQANRLFAPIDVSVQVDSVDALPAEIQEIDDRAARDALGRERFSRGVLHVFVTPRLADVDIAGEEIRGVHWRYRPDTARRWIILSKIASDLVLSHEMGHFFGLRHSTYKVSLMNKSPRDDPPWSERRFADPELTRMRKHRDQMVRSGMLINRNRSKPKRAAKANEAGADAAP